MDNFKYIYRILKALDDGMDFEEFDFVRISPEIIGLSRERWEQLLIQLQKSGYVEGLNIRQYVRQIPRILPPISPRITLKGLEYLHENSIMQNMKAAAAGIVGTAANLIP